jgi:hypothetical protein
VAYLGRSRFSARMGLILSPFHGDHSDVRFTARLLAHWATLTSGSPRCASSALLAPIETHRFKIKAFSLGDVLLVHSGANLEMTDRHNRTRRPHWQKVSSE